MSEQYQDDSEAVIPSISGTTPSTTNTDTSSAASTNHHFGTITRTIGTGENAKNSIVWMTITRSFAIPTGITATILLLIFIAYFQEKATLISELPKYITTTWSIFTPIITLALGYAFGRNETK